VPLFYVALAHARASPSEVEAHVRPNTGCVVEVATGRGAATPAHAGSWSECRQGNGPEGERTDASSLAWPRGKERGGDRPASKGLDGPMR